MLGEPSVRDLLALGRRGIERESLRVEANGQLQLNPHPTSLGSTLTHPSITTDYSESLMEFITPAELCVDATLARLDEIHRFVYSKLGDGLLWNQSMPCDLPKEEDIPIAWYGKSHIGMIKHVYRRGLALRYGKSMQCIAGIHYNYSLAEELWEHFRLQEHSTLSAKDYQSERYIALIRNFHRYSWLLMYLFGASPAVASSFLKNRPHQLEQLSDDTLYLPHATSLRMSDLGYQNNAQDGLVPPYNTLLEYMQSLSKAVRKPYAPYEELGMKRDGEWWQINTNVLQIENEFYATIRPKRVIQMTERPVEALCARGVQYIEVRCMDTDPFEATGISASTARFLEAFLLFCALDESPLTNQAEGHENQQNFSKTVKQGRLENLQLSRHGTPISLKDWGLELCEKIAATAQLLDEQQGTQIHMQSLKVQCDKLENSNLCPSAQVLAALKEHNNSFEQFNLHQSRLMAEQLKQRPLSHDQVRFFEDLAQSSLQAQADLESIQKGSFDEFIADYRSRTSSQICCDELKTENA
jgi:glutamate--cysteine ligase